MQLHSTQQSIAAGKITVLAVLETFASVAIYTAIAFRYDSITHIAIAVCCAPLLLLRTRYSYRLGIALFDRYLGKDIDARSGIMFFSGIAGAPLAGPIIRFLATLIGTLRHPILTIKEMPRNWYKQCLCTDLAHIPELVPGEEKLTSVKFGFSFLLFTIPGSERFSLTQRSFLLIIRYTILIFGYTPALLLRISFKATSIVYLPLIFVAQTTAASRNSLKLRLARICRGEMEKARRYVSVTILILATLKILVILALIDTKSLDDYTISATLAQHLLASNSWPFWQVLLLSDAVITMILWLFADRSLLDIEFGEMGSAIRIRTILDTLSFVRGLLASTAVVVGVSLAARLLFHRYFLT